jgi:hypothetical protein
VGDEEAAATARRRARSPAALTALESLATSDEPPTLAALDTPAARRQRHPEYQLLVVVLAVSLLELVAWLSGAVGHRSSVLRAALGLSP